MIDNKMHSSFLTAACNMTVDEYIDYLVRLKSENPYITWCDIKNLTNEAYELTYSEEFYRKHNRDKLIEYMNSIKSNECDNMYEEDVEDYDSSFEDDVSEEYYLNIIREETIKLQKERIKFKDEATAARKIIRESARQETIRDIAINAAIAAAKEKPFITNKNLFISHDNDENQAILEIGDWHYGEVFKNFINEYSPEICKRRVAELYEKVIKKLKLYNVKKLYVVDLSDLIAGRIHKTIQLESRFNVIDQIMQVTEILAELLMNLSQYVDIEYYSTIDNHSRLDKDKEAELSSASLQRLTPWYLEERLKDCNVHINDNYYGDDICAFEVMGHRVLGVHGDKDNHITAVDKLSMMTEQHWDLLCTAHLHHFSCDEKNRTVVCSCSSLMGTDTFAKGLRLTATPSQNLIIVSKENVTEDICRIILH